MLFMSGHLMFFRHEARVMEEFFNFKPLRSVQAFLATPKKWIDPGAGELRGFFGFLTTSWKGNVKNGRILALTVDDSCG